MSSGAVAFDLHLQAQKVRAGDMVMMKTLPFMGGLGAGAGLMLFLDPAGGVRRRALVRDKLARSTRVARDAAGTTARDLRNRAHGAAAVLQRLGRAESVTDEVLVERVRAALGRWISRMRAIEVTAADGTITLAGPILATEHEHALSAAAAVPGTRGLIDCLEPHTDSTGIPALQGAASLAAPRTAMLHRRRSPGMRAMVMAIGGAILGYGAVRRFR